MYMYIAAKMLINTNMYMYIHVCMCIKPVSGIVAEYIGSLIGWSAVVHVARRTLQPLRRQHRGNSLLLCVLGRRDTTTHSDGHMHR